MLHPSGLGHLKFKEDKWYNNKPKEDEGRMTNMEGKNVKRGQEAMRWGSEEDYLKEEMLKKYLRERRQTGGKYKGKNTNWKIIWKEDKLEKGKGIGSMPKDNKA